MDTSAKRPLMIPRGWIQAAAIVLIFGFFLIGVLTFYTYNDEPPIRGVIKSTNGSTLFTRGDIMAGQQIFLAKGLMEYGSIFGHGAYLGPDFTAEYLHRAAIQCRRTSRQVLGAMPKAFVLIQASDEMTAAMGQASG